MKKQIAIIAASLAAVCCLGGCGKKTEDQYTVLNRMLEADYSQIVLNVTNTFDEELSLTSTYSINYSPASVTVHYTIERFGEPSLENPDTQIIEKLKGVATIKNGEVVSDTGKNSGLTADIATLTLKFKRSYFQNTLFTGEFFVADVIYPYGFMGTKFAAQDMKLKAYHDNFEVFDSIQITYTSSAGYGVEYSYSFTM